MQELDICQPNQQNQYNNLGQLESLPVMCILLQQYIVSQNIVCLLYAIKLVRQDEVGMPLHATSVLCQTTSLSEAFGFCGKVFTYIQDCKALTVLEKGVYSTRSVHKALYSF